MQYLLIDPNQLKAALTYPVSLNLRFIKGHTFPVVPEVTGGATYTVVFMSFSGFEFILIQAWFFTAWTSVNLSNA